MKIRIISILLVLVLAALLLTACPSPEPTPTPAVPSTPAAQPTTPAAQPTTPAAQPTTPAAQPTTPAAPAPKTVTFKMSYTMPKGKSVGGGLEWFATEFEKRSDGRYKVESYPANSLVQVSAIADAVKGGVSEIGLVPCPGFATTYPVSMLPTVPSLAFPFGDYELHKKQWAAWWEFMEFPEMQEEYKDYKVLWPFGLDGSIFVSKDKEFHCAQDFNGMAVGGGAGPVMAMVKAYGGAEVAAMAPQVYMNMDKGVLDGAFMSYGAINDYKLYEIAEYFYDYEFSSGILMLLMNRDAWNAMPAEDQALFEATVLDATKVASESMLTAGLKGKQDTIDSGSTVIEPTEEERAAWEVDSQPAFDDWIEDVKALGINDPEGIIERFKAVRDKYID